PLFMHAAKLESAHNIDDLAELARRRLPRIVFDFLEGGAEDELTLRENREAFNRWRLMPEILKGNVKRSLEIELFGHRLAAPFLVAPTGLSSIFWPQGDLHMARACASMGLGLCLSTAANAPL